MYYDILTYDPHLPRLGCCGARRLTSATHRKGITVDDTTLRYCAGRVPQQLGAMWPLRGVWQQDGDLTKKNIKEPGIYGNMWECLG
jgi:hypothetical protein